MQGMLEQVKVLSFPVERSQTAHDSNRWEMALDEPFRSWSGCGHNHSRCSCCPLFPRSRCSHSRTFPRSGLSSSRVPVGAWPLPGGRGRCHVVLGPAPRPVRHVCSFRRARWRWRSPGPGLAAGAVTAPSRGQGSASPARPGAAAVPFPRSGAESGCVIFLFPCCRVPRSLPRRCPRSQARSPVFPGAASGEREGSPGRVRGGRGLRAPPRAGAGGGECGVIGIP